MSQHAFSLESGMGSTTAAGIVEQLRTLIELGGPVIVILMMFSVVVLAIVFLKLWQFTALRVGARRFVKEALARWQARQDREAHEMLSAVRNPIARVLEISMWGQMDSGIAESKVREEIARVGAEQLENLRSHLRSLEVIATLSPLLGLLGTVLGMIEAFQRMEEAGSRINPAILSGGIWEALLTTAAGLLVAIPTIVVLNGFERTIERLGHDMENAVTQVFTRDMVGTADRIDSMSVTEPQPQHAH
jgi:biopolymer transport protein ExbB